MPAPRVKIEGIADLAAKLKDLKDPKQVGPTLKRGVRAGMLEPARRARQLIPIGVDAHQTYKGRLVAPGFAKRSIRIIAKILKGGQAAYALLGVRAEAFYAVQYVELGTSKMQPRPWLRPAFLSSNDPMLRALGGELNDWIKRIAVRKRAAGENARAYQLEQNAAEFDT